MWSTKSDECWWIVQYQQSTSAYIDIITDNLEDQTMSAVDTANMDGSLIFSIGNITTRSIVQDMLTVVRHQLGKTSYQLGHLIPSQIFSQMPVLKYSQSFYYYYRIPKLGSRKRTFSFKNMQCINPVTFNIICVEYFDL